MAYKKITEADLLGVGLLGIPDTPGLSTEEMQEKFEETARQVIIPAFNRFVDDVTERDNNTYTKEETDQAINDKVQEIGSADMRKAVYDSDNDGIVDSADNGTFLYVHTAGSLTGTGRYGAFKATAGETLANVNVNGSAFSVRCGDESEIELTAGSWYSFILDGDTVNFKQGGAGLNFKIVGGTAQPASPKENTIWINTDMSIPKWEISFSRPQASVAGQVWLVAGAESDISFNTLKKNGITVKIIAAEQWNGTEWVDVVVKGYINGGWKDSDIYVFSASHGINRGTWQINNDGTVSVSESEVLVQTNEYTYGYAVCSEGIDVTNFNTVVFNVSNFYQNDNDAVYHYVGLAPEPQANDNFVSKVMVDGAKEYTIDISSLTGIFYPKIQVNSHGHDDDYLSRIGVNEIRFTY